MQAKIALFGATGFIGQELISYFKKQGATLLIFSRKKQNDTFYWNPERQEIDSQPLEGVDLVINLAGETLMGWWSKKKKERIAKSRIESSRFLVSVLQKLRAPPKLYIGASAIGYYGTDRKELLTEKSERGEGFLADVCEEWEKCTEPLKDRMRLCHARFGIVLGKEGGILKKISFPIRFGRGNFWMSWIALPDVARALHHMIDHQELEGAINVTTPYPVTQQEFVNTLAGHPVRIYLPEWFLRLFLREASTFVLASQNVVPERLLETGFQFFYPKLRDVLEPIHFKIVISSTPKPRD